MQFIVSLTCDLVFFRPEKEEIQMMKAVIPLLRLLLVPVDKLDPLSKYLTNSQMLYLAKQLIFKVENGVANVSPGLNSSTLTRNGLKINQDVLKMESKLVNLIAEDLIKTDCKMTDLNPNEKGLKKVLQIHLIPQQNLLVKGIEILTRAKEFVKVELANSNNEESG